MNRVERFRESKKIKRKYFYSILLSLFLVLAGLGVVDYSVNSLMKDDRNVKIISFQTTKSHIIVNVMEKKYYCNITYLKRDYKRFKKIINEALS